jgi:butyryl-CoA dehydrogenase
MLSQELQLIKDTARNFAQAELTPNADRWAQESHFPKEALDKMAKLGFMGMLVPESYGGCDVGYQAYAHVIEEIARGDGATSTIIAVHNSVGCLPILKFGSEQQKKSYLPKMCKGEWLGAFCLSEPQAGSDASNLTTKAVKDGDDFVLNGVKQFVTSGKNADIAIVFAMTSPDKKAKGISAFIVPTNTPGFNVARIEKKMGQTASEIAQISLQDCRIPQENLLGHFDEGYKIALSNLEGGRIGVAAQAVGMGQSALDAAINYVNDRESFGKPLIEHQAIAFRLADMTTRLEAARQLVYSAAFLKENHHPCLIQAAQAKLFASESAEYVAREAIQIHGGYGYLTDFPVERIYRDVRVTSIYEGTSDIQKMIIARHFKQ